MLLPGLQHLQNKERDAMPQKKAAIVGIVSANAGNRLQNYALQQVLGCSLGASYRVETLRRGYPEKNVQTSALKTARRHLRPLKRAYKKMFCPDVLTAFKDFDKTWIDFSRLTLSVEQPQTFDSIASEYELFVIGSDQVWNPDFDMNSELEYLPFVAPAKKLAYAASFGVSDIVERRDRTRELLDGIPSISMRERAGADIVRDLTGREVSVVLDPTLLLSSQEWESVSKRPARIQGLDEPYLLKYVLGDDAQGQDIDSLARHRDLHVVELGDPNLPVGPAEFVWLISHAALVCADSFHASVFSIINSTPFIIFERVSKDADMSSRFDTLCGTFACNYRRFSHASFDLERCLDDDWARYQAVLSEEKTRSIAWLDSALEGARTKTGVSADA